MCFKKPKILSYLHGERLQIFELALNKRTELFHANEWMKLPRFKQNTLISSKMFCWFFSWNSFCIWSDLDSFEKKSKEPKTIIQNERQHKNWWFFERCARWLWSFPAKMTTNKPEVKFIVETRLVGNTSGVKNKGIPRETDNTEEQQFLIVVFSYF